jgi:hypothetical protein
MNFLENLDEPQVKHVPKASSVSKCAMVQVHLPTNNKDDRTDKN